MICAECYLSAIDESHVQRHGATSSRLARWSSQDTCLAGRRSHSRSGGMADAMDSKSIVPKGRVGSSPTFGTLKPCVSNDLRHTSDENRQAFFIAQMCLHRCSVQTAVQIRCKQTLWLRSPSLWECGDERVEKANRCLDAWREEIEEGSQGGCCQNSVFEELLRNPEALRRGEETSSPH